MTEAEGRAVLRAFVVGGDVEPWIAEQPWKAESGGWSVAGEHHGLRFHLEVMPGGVRVIIASEVGGGRLTGGPIARAFCPCVTSR
jgi:hypothetical protein